MQDYRLPRIEDSFKFLARDVQNQRGGGLSLGTSRLEYVFSGWTLEVCCDKALQFCDNHGVPGLLDVREQTSSSTGSPGSTISSRRREPVSPDYLERSVSSGDDGDEVEESDIGGDSACGSEASSSIGSGRRAQSVNDAEQEKVSGKSGEDEKDETERAGFSPPPARSTTREEQILILLRGYHVKIYAIPVDQMMTGFLDTLESLRDIISKFASSENSKGKENRTSQDRDEFSSAWVKHLAEFGFRKATLGRFEQSILTDPASHPDLLEDLIKHGFWVSKKPSEGLQEQGRLQCRLLDRVKSRDDSEAFQKIGLSTAGRSGLCPRCGVSLGDVLPRNDGLAGSQTKYHHESKHILDCGGTNMESVQIATFEVEEDETLIDIARLLGEDVYMLLALNIKNEGLWTTAERAIGSYKKNESIPLTVNTKFKPGKGESLMISVPRDTEEEGSEKEDQRQTQPDRDVSGRFQRKDFNPPQPPERMRPDQSSGGPRRRRPKEQFLSSSADKDYLAADSGSTAAKKWFPDFSSAVCYYIHQARNARSKREKICSIEEAWKWRYIKQSPICGINRPLVFVESTALLWSDPLPFVRDHYEARDRVSDLDGRSWQPVLFPPETRTVLYSEGVADQSQWLWKPDDFITRERGKRNTCVCDCVSVEP